MRGRRRDEGAGSVLVVAAVAGLLAVGLSALPLVDVVRATHQARASADLAALAAAQALVGGSPPGSACARAHVVAVANGGRLRGCHADAASGVVVVEVTVPLSASAASTAGLGLSTLGPATSRARAGPAPP